MNERRDDAVLGLARGTVRLVNGDPGWPGAFQRLAARLRPALGPLAVAIEHVGSTAVPGLAAKPILDIAVGLAPDADPGQFVARLAPLGWIFRGDNADSGLLFVLEDRPAHRVAHLHGGLRRPALAPLPVVPGSVADRYHGQGGLCRAQARPRRAVRR